ncbi:hypothetical protein SKAU_G00057990 [Synaphobranchus kaupii]|uniref:MIF4G domain-containing protein n=1 Tax=Synaphobranchus kaupii TaxID=118154 RepID=A0A9Q1G5D9_SYNKA|nr:hypothetical protein SKAU_G00057990 [Synaphobranchus kaupii]
MTVTQELFSQMRSILKKLTPEKFEQLMKEVNELSINTKDRLEGIGNMVFEKAICEVKFTSTYAKMCHCLKEEEESQHLKEELGTKVIAHHRRAVGTMKFLSKLFKLDMVQDVVILGCVGTYLDTQSEEALECLCCLITTTGTVLDCENVKLKQILNEGKITSRVHFMLQDVMDLRQNNWVPRRHKQGPKTIIQVHEEAELEIRLGNMKVEQQLLSKMGQSTICTQLAQAEQDQSSISIELAQA